MPLHQPVNAVAPAVLLIDLENMIGLNPRPATVSCKLDALMSRAGPGVPAVAACAASRITGPGRDVLSRNGVRLLVAGGDKNGADQTLLAEAERLARDGCGRFLVASNDSGFARIAELGRLEIIIWQSQKPARKYTSRAAQVVRLPCPRPPAPASSVPEPQPSAGSGHDLPATGSLPGPDPGLAQTRPAGPGLVRWPSAASLAAAGAGILAAGFLLGAGAELGTAAARRILRHAQPAGSGRQPRP